MKCKLNLKLAHSRFNNLVINLFNLFSELYCLISILRDFLAVHDISVNIATVWTGDGYPDPADILIYVIPVIRITQICVNTMEIIPCLYVAELILYLLWDKYLRHPGCALIHKVHQIFTGFFHGFIHIMLTVGLATAITGILNLILTWLFIYIIEWIRRSTFFCVVLGSIVCIFGIVIRCVINIFSIIGNTCIIRIFSCWRFFGRSFCCFR